MDVDPEHTLPTSDYLDLSISTRLSIHKATKPKLYSTDFKLPRELDENGNTKNAEKVENPQKAFPRGKFAKDPNAPKDNGYFVLITITIFGLAHLLPLMFFFTANEYWMYKFRNTTSESTDANDRTNLQRYFQSLNGLVVTTPGVICNFIAAIAGHKVKAITRVFTVLFIHSSVLVMQAIFVTVDTDSWQLGFFILTLGSQLMMSCAMSLGGSGSMGLISKLPPTYMKAYLMGEGIAAMFSATLRLVSIVVTPSTTAAALMYFIAGSALTIGTSLVFFVATTTNFFRYYTRTSEEDRKEQLRSLRDILDCLKLIWPLILLGLVQMLNPAGSLSSLVVSEFNGTKNLWGDKYFVTVCTYLIPALASLTGRGLFNFLDPDFSITVLWILTVIKEIFFGTLLFLTNAKPRYHLPVLVKHDWEYALLTAGQSFTSGFMMNMYMMKNMRAVPPNRVELSMMITMFFFSIFQAITSPIGVLAVSLL